MGAKDPKHANAAKQGAANQPGADQGVAAKAGDPVEECKHKHYIAVRVEFENGKLVDNGLKLRLKLNDGSVRNVVLGKDAQPSGKYSTGRILVPATTCEVIFPDAYDAECTPK